MPLYAPPMAATLTVLGETTMGNVFGEVSALTGQPRTATVVAKTNVHAAQITREHLKGMLADNPALAKHMSQIVSENQARAGSVA